MTDLQDMIIYGSEKVSAHYRLLDQFRGRLPGRFAT